MTVASDLSATIYAQLVTETDFIIPDVDFTDPKFTFPVMTGDLFAAIPKLDEAALTSRTVDGTGLFDGLMAALNEHLKLQYDANRLTGAQYAEAYVALVQGAMAQAVQFLQTKEQAYWQSMLTQRQAQIAEIGRIQAAVELETAKVQLQKIRVEARTSAVDFAIKKLQLSTQDATFSLTLAQGDAARYQVSHLMPKQLEGMTADISLTTANKDQTLYQTANILPAQKDQIQAEKALSDYQLSAVQPAIVAGYTKDTQIKDYQLVSLLPAQLENTREQTEGHRSKTLDTRKDGTPVAGSVKTSIDLQKEQITSYKRDAESKMVKMMIDTWITTKSLDEGLVTPSELNNDHINGAITNLRARLTL